MEQSFRQLLLNQRVVIMGLGLNGGGLSSAKFALACGAEVLVTDLNSEEKLASSLKALRDFAQITLANAFNDKHAQKRLSYCLGSHELKDFQQADLVIKNPGVSSHSPYLQAAQSWTTDLALFLELYPQFPVLAITGTKGKSSISYALHYILQKYLPKAMLAGNIGCSPLSYALSAALPCKQNQAKIPEFDSSPLILELSSWQLADLRTVEQNRGQIFFRPRQACLSNILNDHQNCYTSFYHYVMDKFYIFENMARLETGELLLGTPTDTMYLGPQFWGDFATRAFYANHHRLHKDFKHFCQHHLHYFCLNNVLPKGMQGLYWLPNGNAYIRESQANRAQEQLFLKKDNFTILGQYSFQNYSIASYMAYRFLQKQNIDLTSFCQEQDNGQLSRKFSGVPFRMEQRGKMQFGNNRTLYFINDTTATMPDATVSGLEACLQNPTLEKNFRILEETFLHNLRQVSQSKHCLLVAGGTDKDLDPSKLLNALCIYRGHYTLFLLQGSGSQTLIQYLQNANLPYFGCASDGDLGFASLRLAFEAAFQTAIKQSYSQQYLLFSPGYASFEMFQNEFDRGQQFNALVAEYLEKYSHIKTES